MANGHQHKDVGDESDCERGYCNPDPDTVQGAIDFLRELGIDARYEHTGGGIFCITFPDARYPEHDRPLIYLGTADGEWGWSDEEGNDHGSFWIPPLVDGSELGIHAYALHVERKRQGEEAARHIGFGLDEILEDGLKRIENLTDAQLDLLAESDEEA